MKRIDILGLHLNYGGTEQAIINQANMLCDNYDVRIVVSYKMIDEPAFRLDKKVKVIYLTPFKPNRAEFKDAIRKKNPIKIIKESFRALKTLHSKNSTMKKYIEQTPADILISSRLSTHKLVKKYAKKSTIKIGEEHRYALKYPKYLRKIQKNCQTFDYFVCVSQEITDHYQKILPKVHCLFIPNALPQNNCKNIANYAAKNLLAIGRLSHEKGFDDAIEIMDILVKTNRNIKLNVIGEGVERPALENKIQKYHLENNVLLHGFKDQKYIENIASNSSLYLLASREESFGTATIEAFSYGLPVVMFDSAKGSLNIVKDQKTGIIIKGRNLNTAASVILNLLNHQEELKKLGKNAFQESKKYSFENVKKSWDTLISLLLEKK